MERITVRIPLAVLKAIEERANVAGYPNRSAYIRRILRDDVSDTQVRRFQIEGQAPPVEGKPAAPTPEDLNEAAKELRDVARRYEQLSGAIDDGRLSPCEVQKRLIAGDD